MSTTTKPKINQDPTEKADKIIQNHMILSIGAGLVPIPLLDMVAVTAIQVDMLKQLSKQYDIDFSEQAGKSWISAIGGTILARLGASAIKAIPVFGSLLGGLSMAALSGAATYGLGKVFKEHYKNGGDLSDIDLDKAKDYFKQKFEEGKELAKKMVPIVEAEKEESKEEKSATDQLSDLDKMKEDGILTTREYEAIRKRILKT